jgi:hypothetical protein
MITSILTFYAIAGCLYWLMKFIKTTPAILGFIFQGFFLIALLPFFPILNTYGQFKRGNRRTGWILAVLSIFVYTVFIGLWILDPPV